ncbi:MAG: cysteine desulfurase NifS [Actinomycetia bacterium]|nr:cysteine desulfurase NifS [Actinomycetes bacterium]
MKKRIYLDYGATTPCDPRVVTAMLPFFSKRFGNPSSIHSHGQEASEILDKAREKIAGYLGAQKSEIIFTSGGTESDNTAIKGVAYAYRKKGNHIITSSIEHPAVIKSCASLMDQGFKVTHVPVDKNGIVDVNEIEKAITTETILISVMHANNEVGTIQPIEDIGKIARKYNICFHTDAVQTFGHIPLEVNKLGVDLLSASAHKLYGPKGAGFLYVRKGTRIKPFMDGGGQEMGKRASTENVPGIVGLAKASEIAFGEIKEETERLRHLQQKMVQGISERLQDVGLNGPMGKRLPGNINLSVRYAEGESVVMHLDQEGISCSTGSACSSSEHEPSHVLKAMGVPDDLARSSVRFSLGRFTTEEDVNFVIDKLSEAVNKLRAISPCY